MRVMLTSCGLETEQIKEHFLRMLGKERCVEVSSKISKRSITKDARLTHNLAILPFRSLNRYSSASKNTYCSVTSSMNGSANHLSLNGFSIQSTISGLSERAPSSPP